MYDVLIVGAGAAGLTSALYTARKKLKTLVISADVGGQMNLTSHIENYPGVSTSTGPGLMKKFQDQAVRHGAEIVIGHVKKVEKNEKGFKSLMANGQSIESKTVILAFGLVPRTLGIPGEEQFIGKGISTCVTCDGPLFKNKTVAVVGGGNSAIEGVLELAEYCEKVYSIHRRDKFTADAHTIDKLKHTRNVEMIMHSALKDVRGSPFLKSTTVIDVNTHKTRDIDVSGIFLQIGHVVDTALVKGIVELTNRNEVVINDRNATSVPGIFAAGDCTNIPFKQTVISAGEGAKAGLEAQRYLKGGKGVSIDWS
ncbi:FAD-dependent oxidoreductase [Candidatus Micrarchaeota archaeon]|nr:FAD-dependent oxidoreductase [Candidatus Micrarchaeota archaeon]